MKEGTLVFKEKKDLREKLKVIQKYNTRKHWLGWAGGYGAAKKK